MPSSAERPRSSQEALLRLEKGTASPTTQLNDAAQIIGLDLTLCASHPEINRATHIRRNAAPKEEWVLRWLLKKLKSEKNYRVDPTSYLLLRQLIDLIPPKTLATTLKDQKFLAILDDSITDLEEDVYAAVESGSAETSHSGSESSHTLDDSPIQHNRSDKKGKKRKRDGEGEGAVDVDEEPRSPASCFVAFVRILDCLYSLVTLANKTLTADEASSAHLKHALKAEPEFIATVLGKSLKVAAVATDQYSNWKTTTDLQHLLYVLPAILELWELRSSRQDDSESKSSNDVFAKHCFRHALRLQICVRSLKLDTDERSQVLHGVERLIALHVVLPARAAFFDRGGSGIVYSNRLPDWSSVKPVTETVRPLLSEPLSDSTISRELKTKGTSSSKKKNFWKSAELLPEFFDIAVRSVSRDTFRKQTHEAPWLETLFVAVAELAFSVAKEESVSNHRSDFIRVLEQLLRVNIDRQVQLSLHTLLAHAVYTNLLKDGLAKVEWNLTALFIKLGVDIFLPNSGLRDAVKLLNALLEKIFLHWRNSASYYDDSDVIKNGIVIPLLRGFAAARDLPTFVQLWHGQLMAVEEARAQNPQNKFSSFFTIWEDNDLCSIYSDLVKTSLTDAQVAAQVQLAATEIKGKNDKVSESPSAYSRFVILEANFKKRPMDLKNASEDLKAILETVTMTLSSKQTLHWRWRLWRLVRNLIANAQSADTPVGNAILGLIDVAAKSIQRLHKDLTKKPGALLEAFEAYRFALISAVDCIRQDHLNKFISLTDEITDFIKKVSTDDALVALKSPWDGRTETLDSSASLALGYFLTLLRIPDVCNQITYTTRRSLFGHMLSLAAAQYNESSSSLENPPSDARFLQAWASVVCHEYLLNAPSIASDLIVVLSDKVKNETINRHFIVESLQRIPASLITRRQRGILLDLLQDVILQKDSTPEVTLGLISLMAKLADMPKSTASVTSDWESVWATGKALDLKGTEIDLQIMRAFRNFHRAVFTKLLVLSEEERQKLFKKFYRKVSSKASKLKSVDCDSMDDFSLRISLSQLWTHREKLSDVLDENELNDCRRRVFDLVVSEVKAVKEQCKKHKLEDTVSLIKTIDALEDFEDLVINNEEVEKFLMKIESYVEKSRNSASSVRKLIRRRILAGRGPEKAITIPMMRCAETLTPERLHAQDEKQFIKATVERFQNMATEDITQVIKELREAGFVGDPSGRRLLVVALAIGSLPRIEDKESATAKELSSVCTAITETVPRSASMVEFSLATECLGVLLRNQTRCISQWNIDSLVACVAICASKSGPRISPEHAGSIYIRLCQLMGLLIGLHRQKLGGRFHIVLPAMQRLMSCLFARSLKRHRSLRPEIAHGQPYWLTPLKPEEAIWFTRLLTSLCDPTVSAVSAGHSAAGHEGLTDETKKAKRVAGQHLQYLIMEYAQCSLRGSLVPEVKAAIMPGLYSVLDIISRDTMRALNAGLDVSGRAVFKSLYDDYMKFGKWNKG